MQRSNSSGLAAFAIILPNRFFTFPSLMDGDTSGRTRHFPGHDSHRDRPAFSRDGGRRRRQNLVRSDFLKHGEGDAALPLALLIWEAHGLVYDFVDAIKNRITLAAVSQGSGPRLAEHRVGHVGLHHRSVRRCAQGLSAEA